MSEYGRVDAAGGWGHDDLTHPAARSRLGVRGVVGLLQSFDEEHLHFALAFDLDHAAGLPSTGVGDPVPSGAADSNGIGDTVAFDSRCDVDGVAPDVE